MYLFYFVLKGYAVLKGYVPVDTPCAAGARSDGLRPSTRILPSSKRTLRNVSRTSQRQFEIPARKSPSAGMESVPNHDHRFLTCCQKVPKCGSKKWSLNRPIQAVNFINDRSTFGSFKIKCSNHHCSGAVKHPPYPPRKNQLFSERRTDNRFSGAHGRKERFAQQCHVPVQ